MEYVEGAFEFHAVEGDGGEAVDAGECEVFLVAEEVLVILVGGECFGELGFELYWIFPYLFECLFAALFELRNAGALVSDLLHVVPPLVGVQFE